MRISVILVIFLILFNGWGGLMQQYDIDDHLGVSTETGNPAELEQAQDNASELQTGNAVGGTLLGYYNGLINTIQSITVAIEPGTQMMINIVPPGIAEDFIIWMSSIVKFIILADIAAYARGVDL